LSDGLASTEASAGYPRERDETRSAILAAARRLYDRDGIEAVRLSAVAAEAQLATAAVYGQFCGRRELLAQLLPQAELPEELRLPEAKAPEAAKPAEAASARAPENSYDSLMRAQAQALDQLARRVIVPGRRDGTDAALSRLETRLGMAEKGIAVLEQRLDGGLKTLEAETGKLAASLKEIRRRVERFEERQQAALAALRLDLLSPQRGISGPPAGAEAVEPGQGSAEVLAFPLEQNTRLLNRDVAPDSISVAPSDGKPLHTFPESAQALPPAAPEERPDPPAEADYLHSARQAAIEAALAAQAAEKPKRRRFSRRSLKRWAAIGIAAFLVLWFDIYVFAHYAPAKADEVQPQAATALKQRQASGPRAQLLRGLRYLNGKGAATDVDRAALWIGRAAAGGDPVAGNFLGVFYQTGTGVAADMKTAIRWYEAAARQGNLKAMTNLGKLYAGGWREGVDYAKAAAWFSRAARYGEVDAAFDLAILYERGQGVSRNLALAYKWYAVAAAGGDSKAASRILFLEGDMTPEELEAGQHALAAFKPHPADPKANSLSAT
jgi:TPR repeat protein